MKFLGLTLLLVLLPHSQAQAPASVSIRGVVVKWGTAEPIAQAMVELRNATDTSGVPLMTTATRANGEYVFSQVAPGRYRIIATREDYAPGEFGQRRTTGNGTTVTLVAGESLGNAQIQMAPAAAISGRVTNANGEPMAVARVQLSRLTYRNGKPELTPQQSTYTNDLGEYRLFWISPGTYYVSAQDAHNNTTPEMLLNPGGNSTYSWSGVFGAPRPTARILRDFGTEEGQIYVPIYYPGNSNWEAARPLELRPGDDVGNINITLIPAVERRVKGQVVDSSGQPVQETIVVSLRQLDASLPAQMRMLQFFPDNGRFQFTVTETGTYEVRATVGMLAGRTIAVLRDRETEVSVVLFPATSLAGQVSFETPAGAASVPLQGVTVTLRGSTEQVRSAVATNGQFSFEKVPVGAYQVELGMPDLPDAYVKSMRMNNVDLLNEELTVDGLRGGPLQIVVGLAGGSVAGRVLNQAQQSVANATVVILPEGMPSFRADRYKSVTVDSSGIFQFRGLPPGDYDLYAWEDVDTGAWFDPAFLQNYESYKRTIRIVEGQMETGDVFAAPVTP